jgi:hypothetical protein
MSAPFECIAASYPHIGEVLDYIKDTKRPVPTIEIKRNLPHISHADVTLCLRYAATRNLCLTHRIVVSSRSNLVTGYGPLTEHGERFLRAIVCGGS